MAQKKSGPELVNEKLHEAIDGLRKDVTRVEIWATALSSFASAAPEYEPNPKYQLGRPVETGKLAENEPRKPFRGGRRRNRE